MVKRVNTTMDDTIHELIKKKAEEKGVSLAGYMTEAAIDVALNNERERTQMFLERYASKLMNVFKQKGMEDAANLVENAFFLVLDDIQPSIEEWKRNEKLKGGEK
ncbi:hypothetical protein XO47_15170 [Listeria monocytogenes]|nr:hypothetical protein [Listeria monocytogenes]